MQHKNSCIHEGYATNGIFKFETLHLGLPLPLNAWIAPNPTPPANSADHPTPISFTICNIFVNTSNTPVITSRFLSLIHNESQADERRFKLFNIN